MHWAAILVWLQGPCLGHGQYGHNNIICRGYRVRVVRVRVLHGAALPLLRDPSVGLGQSKGSGSGFTRRKTP